MNENGDLNLPRFEKYISKLAEHDVEQFRDDYADLKWLEGKLGGKAVNEQAARARKTNSKFKMVRNRKTDSKFKMVRNKTSSSRWPES